MYIVMHDMMYTHILIFFSCKFLRIQRRIEAEDVTINIGK